MTERRRPAAIKCPTCRKPGDWFAGAFGPFCSRQCKLIDLGKWFNEEHVVTEPLRAEHLEGYAELPPGEHLDRPDSGEPPAEKQ